MCRGYQSAIADRTPPELTLPMSTVAAEHPSTSGAASPRRGLVQSLTSRFADVVALGGKGLSYAPDASAAREHSKPSEHRRSSSWAHCHTIAIVGGGPAGLAAAISLLEEHRASVNVEDNAMLAVTILEKRRTAIRRQRVFIDFGRLPEEAAVGLRLPEARLQSLLAAHGVAAVPGAAVELRVLEMCMRQLLQELALASRGSVAVRWEFREFQPQDVHCFDDVIGADGRHSVVRRQLMGSVSRVELLKCALEVEFSYDCHLEWMVEDGVHTLKASKYETWQPMLLYQRLGREELPEYVRLSRGAYQAVLSKFSELSRAGAAPYTEPFSSAVAFLSNFAVEPKVQEELLKAFAQEVDGFDECEAAVVAPVAQTLHRAPRLVSPSAQQPWKRQPVEAASTKGLPPCLWLLGDAAVGLPVSKGCNLIYHIAAAGQLAKAVLREIDAGEYEEFVYRNWHKEAWREKRGAASRPPQACRPPMSEGRFTG